jgi:hydroxymethylglutaryl-CoA lyase
MPDFGDRPSAGGEASVAAVPSVRDRPGFPDVHRRSGFPESVTVYEVGPRDGLQAEKAVIPVATKLELIARLADAGLTVIESTSFVSPAWVPQLADGDELMATLVRRPGVRYPCLVPNQRGLDRALAAGVEEIAVFVSATERFARENLGTSRDGAVAMVAPVVRQAVDAGLRVRGYVSMCFGDPWEGRVEPSQPASVAQRLVELGCDRISLGDTIGVATVGHVHDLLEAVATAGIGGGELALHFHDTYGQALSNVVAGLEAGVTEFDASAGGLGGCPYARSATGNLATEDLVWLLSGLGIRTGVDLAALVSTSTWLAGRLGRPSPSRVVAALAHER